MKSSQPADGFFLSNANLEAQTGLMNTKYVAGKAPAFFTMFNEYEIKVMYVRPVSSYYVRRDENEEVVLLLLFRLE